MSFRASMRRNNHDIGVRVMIYNNITERAFVAFETVNGQPFRGTVTCWVLADELQEA